MLRIDTVRSLKHFIRASTLGRSHLALLRSLSKPGAVVEQVEELMLQEAVYLYR